MYYSLELEQNILSLSLIKKYNIVNLIESDDFYFKVHKIIFKNLKNLFFFLEKINIEIINEFFEKKNMLNLFKYLVFIIQNTPNSSNVIYLTNLFIYMSFIRKLLKLFSLSVKNKGFYLYNLFKNFEKNLIKLSLHFDKLLLMGKLINNVFDEDNIKFLSTGFLNLDKILLGFYKNDLIIIAGRPSMGKTAFSMNIALNIVFRNNLSVIIFSLEMSSEQILIRILSFFSDIDQNIIRSGNLNFKEKEIIDIILKKIYFCKIFIDDSINVNIELINKKCKNLLFKFGDLSLIVIDYLQLLNSLPVFKNKIFELSELLKSLKKLSKNLNVPIIVVSQLNRSLESRNNKKPLLSDLRDSGSIEQDADVVIFIYREEIYNKNITIKGKVDIIISKQRNGPTGDILLNFNENSLKFY